jgi:hypothetical protein
MSEAVNLAKKSSEQPSWVYPLGAERDMQRADTTPELKHSLFVPSPLALQ